MGGYFPPGKQRRQFALLSVFILILWSISYTVLQAGETNRQPEVENGLGILTGKGTSFAGVYIYIEHVLTEDGNKNCVIICVLLHS